MSNSVFPDFPGRSWPISRKPVWSTKVQESVSGKETRIGFWSYPRWDYTIDLETLRLSGSYTEMQSLAGFYNAVNCDFDDWLFLDPFDSVATTQIFGVGNGTTTTFQLARSFGGYVEPVRAVSSVSQVRVAGTPTVAYTLDQYNGKVTFSSPPGVGATLDWTGVFYWRCRFEEGSLTLSIEDIYHSMVRSLGFRTLK